MPITEDRIGKLREFGLSEYAARAYLALLDLGVTEASEISKMTKVPTSKIYHVLEQLHDKGLVEILPEYPKKYAPVPFSEYLDKIRREHEEAMHSIERERDALTDLFSVVGNLELGDRGSFNIVRGRRNVLEKVAELVADAGESLLLVATPGMAQGTSHWLPVVRAAADRGVRTRVLAPLTQETVPAFEPLREACEVRAKDLDDAGYGTGVAILVGDARRALIINFVPDDGSGHGGKDVAIFTDHVAIVAALQGILEPSWARAPRFDEARAVLDGAGPVFTRLYTSLDDAFPRLLAALDRGFHEFAATLPFPKQLMPERRAQLLARIEGAGARLRVVADLEDLEAVELVADAPPGSVRHLGGIGYTRKWIVDDREAFFAAGGIGEEGGPTLLVHTNDPATVAAFRRRFEDLWTRGMPLERRREELTAFPVVRPRDLGIGRVFDAVGDAIVVADPDGRIVLWNPAAAALFGYASEEAVGRPLADLFDAPDGPRPTADDRRTLEARGVRKDGSHVDLELTLSPIDDRGVEGHLLAILRPVHARADGSGVADVVVASAPVGVLAVDEALKCVLVNGALERLWTPPPEGATGRPLREAFPALPPAALEALARAVDGEEATTRVALPGRGAFDLDVAPLHGPDGRPSGAVAVVRPADAAATAEGALRRAFDASGMAECLADLDGRIARANPAFVGAVGREPAGAALVDLVHPDDVEAVEDALARLRKGGAHAVVECRLLAEGDRLAWVRMTLSAVRDRAGAAHECIVQMDDITAQKTSEEELKRTLSLLTATLESTADGILVVDRSGRVVSHNQRFLEMWRVGERALRQRDDARLAPEMLEQLKEPETFARKIEESDTRPDAETFDVVEFKDGRVFERHSQPQRVGMDVVGRVWSFRDVTGQRRVEHALRQAEVYYRGLVQSARAIFWRADPASGEFTFVSREAENLLGYPIGRWLSEPDFWAGRLHPEDKEWVLEFRRRAVRERRAHEYEYRMVASDGRTVWVRDIVRVSVRDGRPVEVVGVMIDITDRKEAEESLRDHSERLAEIVTTQRDIARGGMQLDDLMTLVCVRAQRLTHADAAVLGLQRDGRAVHAAVSGAAVDLLGEPLDPLGAYALKVETPVRADDVALDERSEPSAYAVREVRSLAAVPIRLGSRTVGVLEVVSSEPSAFGDRDLDMLDVLGGLIAAAIGDAADAEPSRSLTVRTPRSKSQRPRRPGRK